MNRLSVNGQSDARGSSGHGHNAEIRAMRETVAGLTRSLEVERVAGANLRRMVAERDRYIAHLERELAVARTRWWHVVTRHLSWR